jgi:FHS family glucose/mannose:H+ symporter-like MFS transporter
MGSDMHDAAHQPVDSHLRTADDEHSTKDERQRTRDRGQGPPSRRSLLAPLFAGFVLTGVSTAIIGPILPALSALWRLDDTETGGLIAARSLGCLAGVGAVWILTRGMGLGRILAVGFAMAAVGSLVTPVDSWALGVAALFVTGAGLTVATAGANLYVAATSGERRAEALNLLNFLWGVGAASSPAFAEVLGGTRVGPPMLTLAAGFAIVTVWTVLGEDRTRSASTTIADAAAPRSGVVWLLGVVIFFYVGAEIGVGGWVGMHALRFEGAPETAGMIATSAFWGALVTGRLLAPLALRRVRGERFVLLCIAVAAGGALMTARAGSWEVAAVGAGFAGLGFAPIFPTAFATFARAAGATAAKSSWIIFGFANLGGSAIPWLVGAVSDATGALGAGLLVPVGACALMFGVQCAVAAAERR